MTCGLIVIGRFACTGKTTIAKRLATELSVPKLSSDILGRTIKQYMETNDSAVDAYWIAYEVLFCLCEEFVQPRVSTILETSYVKDFVCYNYRPTSCRAPRQSGGQM